MYFGLVCSKSFGLVCSKSLYNHRIHHTQILIDEGFTAYQDTSTTFTDCQDTSTTLTYYQDTSTSGTLDGITKQKTGNVDSYCCCSNYPEELGGALYY